MATISRIHNDKAPVRIHYISEWIERRGMSQADVAKALEVDKGSVSKWCKGALPQETNLIRLADLLSIDPPTLFRHPDDDWIARLFRNRSVDELKRMAATIQAAFPRAEEPATGTEDK